MTRLAAMVAALGLLLAVPAADGKRAHGSAKAGKRADRARADGDRRRGVTRASRASAPSAWRLPAGFAAPGATPTPATTPTPAPTPDTTLPAPSTRSVSVGSTEFAFTLSQTIVDAGDVRVEFDNSRAEDPHQLFVTNGTDAFDFGELEPGQVKRMTIPLKSGTYDLLCPLGDHEAKGMRARLTVR